MRLNEMAVFERVVREGSFTSAAKELGLSKSSVSGQVSRLEEALGIRLLERNTRTMGLTDAGRVYYDYCRRIVAEAREAKEAVQRTALEPTGRIRLTAPTLFGDAFMAPIINAYLSRHRKVSVELLLTERMVDIIDEGFDVAIRIGKLEDSSLHMRSLGRARSIFVASPGYLDARGVPEEAADLSLHDCVVVGKGPVERWPVMLDGKSSSVSVRGRLTVNSLNMGLAVARESMGIAWLPTFLCHDAIANGELLEVLPACAPPPYSICAVYSSKRHMSVRVRSFLELLVEKTADDPPWSKGC